MKRLVILAILGALGWQGYTKFQSHHAVQGDAESTSAVDHSPSRHRPSDESQFKCDGRIYCSQMTSCSEATFFLRHCPGVKMDGNQDGVPCEQQWCR